MTLPRSDPPQQAFVPTNCVIGASNQATVMPVMFVPANTVSVAPGLTAWPNTAVSQFAVMQGAHAADTREISEQDFRSEVGKKLQFCVSCTFSFMDCYLEEI